MTLEQAGAVVLIGLFAVFIIWGRTRGGQTAVRRIYGSRRDPSPTRKPTGKSSSTSSARPKTARRTASRRGRAK